MTGSFRTSAELVLAMRITACLMAAATGAAAAQSQDETAIRAAREAQNQAIAASQLDSAATFWVTDVAVIAGLGLPFQGRDAYRRAFAGDTGMVYQRTPVSVRVSENWPIAWEEGTWTGRRGHQAVAPLVTGRYSTQWVKAKGRWLIRAELFVALTCSGEACGWPLAPTAP